MSESVQTLVFVAMALVYAGFLVHSSIRFQRQRDEKMREMEREHREALERLTRATLESGRIMNPEPTPSQRAYEERMAREADMDPSELRAQHKKELSFLNDVAMGTLRKPD